MAQDGDQRQSAGQAAANKAKDFAKEKAKEQIKKMAAKKGLATALAPVLFWAAIIIICIILLTGIIAFILTAPGLVTGKLKDYAESIGKSFISYWGGDSTKMEVSEEEQYKVLDYLEQMGYDLKGYGFIDSNVSDTESSDYDETQGVLRYADTGKIRDANSYLVMLYLMSDNYVYTVKNFNPVTPSGSVLETIFFYLYKISDQFNLLNRFLELFQVGIIDETAMWGKGLMSIYFEDSEWHKGEDYKRNLIDDMFGLSTTWTNIKVDPAKKTMSIRRGWGANYYEYQLDGWTGRYGMPLEFLLSVQVATLKPDLAYEMATGFNTDILILLRDISGASSLVASYKTESGKYITYKEVDDALHELHPDSDGFVWDFLNWFDDLAISDDEKDALVELGFEESLTKNELKAIIDALDDANEYHFRTYMPYISRVTDHWFRDVYFVVGADSNDAIKYNGIHQSGKTSSSIDSEWWVKTDLDYEALTNERWTDYERYSASEANPEIGIYEDDYKLYVYEDPTETYTYGDLFQGTQEEADAQGIKVFKKANMGSINNLIDEGYLDDESVSGGIWTAYKTQDTGANGSYRRLYPEEDENTYKGRLYYKELLSGNVVQKEDAVRRETNPKIKNMFLSRKYFTYDGTAPKADEIMQVREKIRDMDGTYKNINNVNVDYSKYYYGAVPEALLDGEGTTFTVKTTKEDAEGNTTVIDKEVNIKDMVSTVSLNQDSLAAFAMLENTHTEDADFIYRDFKELIVELGFFTKEDLTAGNPRLLAWPVPDIGSGGYPKRLLDKNEDVIGTKIHSKEDLDSAVSNFMKELAEQSKPDGAFGDTSPSPESSRVVFPEDYHRLGVVEKASEHEVPDRSIVGNITYDRGKIKNFLSNPPGAGHEFKGATLVETATNCWKYIVDNGSTYTYAGASIPITSGTTVDCSSYVSWVLYEYGYDDFEGGQHDTYAFKETNWNELYGWQEFEIPSGSCPVDLQPGDMIVRHEGYSGDELAGTHHITFVVEVEGDSIKCFDCGSEDNWTCAEAQGGNPVDKSYFLTASGDGKVIRIEDQKREGKPYVGYEGNEAVVAPATGILLEYGTYTEEDGQDGYRDNTDPVKEEYLNGPEKVGYAKILVLSKEISDQFVQITNGDATGNAIAISPPRDPEEVDNWTDTKKKALYGYGLFADQYEKAKIATDVSGEEKKATEKSGRYEDLPEASHGIAGYIMYIDGFVTELPNAEAQQYVDRRDSEGETPQYMEIPGGGYQLSMDVFKNHAYTIGSDYESENLYDCSQYQKDEVMKLVSETVQKKEEAKADGKEIAVNLLKTSISLDGETKERLLIKEGTVIGRTMSNKELMVKIRGLDNYVPPKEVDEDEDLPLYGNYLRMVLKDRKDENVENVEDYLKLDDDGDRNTDIDDYELFYWTPYEAGAWDRSLSGPEQAEDHNNSAGEVSTGIAQWTRVNEWDEITGAYIPYGVEYDPAYGGLRALTPIVRTGPSSASRNQIQALISQYCGQDRDAYLKFQIELAKFEWLDRESGDVDLNIGGERVYEAYPWAKDAPAVVQGTIMSYMVRRGSYKVSILSRGVDLDAMSSNYEEICSYETMAKIFDEGRARYQSAIALAILHKEISESDVETWCREGHVEGHPEFGSQ